MASAKFRAVLFRSALTALTVLVLGASPAAADPACSAFVSLDEPTAEVYYASQGGAAQAPFSTYDHYIEIVGNANASYCVVWHLTLRCMTAAGAHVAYVDTDWSGEVPAVADDQGFWYHYADGCGELEGSLNLSAGSYTARGEGYFTAHFVGGDPDDSFGAMASPASKGFGVVTEAPPPGGGGS